MVAPESGQDIARNNIKTMQNSKYRPVLMAVILWLVMHAVGFIAEPAAKLALWSFTTLGIAAIFAIILKNGRHLLWGAGLVLWVYFTNALYSVGPLAYFIWSFWELEKQRRTVQDNLEAAKPATGGMFQSAEFWMRGVAAIVDLIIFTLLFKPMLAAIASGMGVTAETPVQIAVIVFAWLAGSLMESSATGKTFGKMLMDIKVADLDGRTVSFKTAAIRNAVKYFWFVALFYIVQPMLVNILIFGLFIAFAMALKTSRKRALQDFLASTVVIYPIVKKK